MIYKMNCTNCGSHFEHLAGIGFACVCRDCGEGADESAPFFCPVCNKKFEPESEEFNASLVEAIAMI